MKSILFDARPKVSKVLPFLSLITTSVFVTEPMLPDLNAVSYTHLDVYKRQHNILIHQYHIIYTLDKQFMRLTF